MGTIQLKSHGARTPSFHYARLAINVLIINKLFSNINNLFIFLLIGGIKRLKTE